jgi:hypothetical protein
MHIVLQTGQAVTKPIKDETMKTKLILCGVLLAVAGVAKAYPVLDPQAHIGNDVEMNDAWDMTVSVQKHESWPCHLVSSVQKVTSNLYMLGCDRDRYFYQTVRDPNTKGRWLVSPQQ